MNKPKKDSVIDLIEARPYRRDLLIEYLHLIMDQHGCIDAADQAVLAELLHISPVEVHEVASFYSHFKTVASIEKNLVRVCDSLSCELAGSEALIQSLSGDFSVERVSCVGRCDRAPVAVIGKHVIDLASEEKINSSAIEEQEGDAEAVQSIDLKTYRSQGGYRLLNQCQNGEIDVDSLIDTLEEAGLRGLGGAGFPVGRKWRIVREQPEPRYMVVNVDEGEPGTFKDRFYLESDPHRMLEGMLLAAWAVGCQKIYVYVRDEYPQVLQLLKQALADLSLSGDFNLPPIELRRGAGAYICGEESALIESIEGKRGMPRQRPPYIAEVGLFGQPTLEHNAESLYWIRDLIENGARKFMQAGSNGRHGWRSFSLSGRVSKPGVYKAAAGITVNELIGEYGGGMLPGHEFYAYLPGGASGGILPAELGDLPLDFDTLEPYGCFIGSAAVVILSNHDSAKAAALNAMRFFARESCGQCSPCRIGTHKAVELMAAEKWDVNALERLADVMADASICGLGQAAPNPLRCVLRYFSDEIEVTR